VIHGHRITGQPAARLTCAAAGRTVAATTYASRGQPPKVQRPPTAASEDGHRAHRATCDDGQPPRGAASSGRRGPCPIRARSKGQTRTLAVTHGADVIVMTCISAGPAEHSRSLPSWGWWGEDT
jgi:hypothetical protein